MGALDYGSLLARNQSDGSVPDNNEMPAYQFNADNHNYGNGNFAITDPSTWSTGLDSAGKFIATAAISGVNSFYNTGVTAANWLGADLQENDTGTYIASIDDDLGQYYKENKQAVDLGGFLLTSIVPGMAGVKLVNAGQKVLRTAQETGMIGSNLARATGLLTPSTKAYTTLAAADIAQSSATFSAVTGNALKAIGAGYGQAALESAAFEIAVQATSFKSPTLDQQDGWDIAKNILTGTVTGGIIGGAINHAITVGSIKGAVKAFNPVEKTFADTSDLTSLTPAQRIIARNDRLSTLPDVPTPADILAGNVDGTQQLLKDLAPAEQSIVAGNLAGKLTRLKDETQNSLQLKNRSDFQSLVSGNDPAIANQIADLSMNLSGNQSLANMESLTEFGRMNTKLSAEKSLSVAARRADVATNPPPYQIGYLKLNGDGVGNISFDAPKILGIADGVNGGTKDVLAAVQKYKFKESQPWSSIEQGSDHIASEARFIWADRYAQISDGAKIGEHDIPLLEKAIQNKVNNITVLSADGNYDINSAADIAKHLQVSKQEVASELMQASAAGTGMSTEEIAKITNVRLSYLEGQQSQNLTDDLFARQGYKNAYVQDLKSKGLWSQDKEDAFALQPTYAKAAYDTSTLTSVDQMQVSGMAYLKAQQKLYQQGVDNVFFSQMSPELANRFWHPGDDMLLKTNRFGSGPGLVTFANGGYNTPESWAESIGSATSALQKSLKDSTSTAIQSSLYKIASKQEVALEFESINKTIQSTSELYGINAAGTGLEPLRLLDWKAAQSAGTSGVTRPVLQQGAPELIPITHPDTLEAWTTRTNLTGARTSAFQDIRNAQGLTDMKDPRALRPIRPDPKEYPYYALVSDPTITGVGHKSMIHAASPQQLEDMIAKVPSQYEVFKGDQLKQYFKANGEFDYESTLHENYIDADLKRSGVNNPFFLRTDPQLIAKSFLQDHLKSDDIFSRELVNAKYEKEFGFLRQQGEQYTNTATSKYTGSFRDIENSVKNPYLNYVKTALNVSQISEYPLLQGLNTKLDQVVSRTWQAIDAAVAPMKSPSDLDALNQQLNKFGVKSAYYDAATDLLANHTAPRGVLTGFIGKANAMLSTLVTRLDPLNAINNAVGSTVLYGSELKSFITAMGKDDTELAGKLSGLLKTPIPSAASLNPATAASVPQVTTAGKVIQQAVKNWFDQDAVTASGVPLKKYYQDNGWSTRLVDQAQQMMQDLTLQGGESVGTIGSKLNSAFASFKELAEKGEKWTGNKYAEEFNRFVSADSMRQLTDLGVVAGKITDQEALGYINTFVNRTQGNTLASQRPLMFQGAIGQAVGLFQSFQFNMMQQLFRHVSEGQGKDAAMLLGLQGTMYGMNGLPGFNFLNTHILGTMSGNPAHTDGYSAAYGIAGKSVGDLLLYGLPSNLLRANLYSRGDINPRQATVIPVNPVDIPFVNATMKMYDNVANTLGKVQNGGSIWESLLQGIEHNGLSRPLAGLAQTAQALTHNGEVFSTTGKGSISGGNDLMSWATATRLAGGKPFDDSVANDGVFRLTAYQAADKSRLDSLSAAVKSSVIGGASPDPEQLNTFVARYAAAGGKQQQFNKFMLNEIKAANTNKANAIMNNLKNPYAQRMQQVMGGTQGLDGSQFSGDSAGNTSLSDY